MSYQFALYCYMISLKDQAIQYALQNKWEEAVTANLNLLEENPRDIESLNRVAFAYLKLNKIDDAKTFYEKVLAFDNTNPIALKNLKKIQGFSKDGNHTNHTAEIKLDNLFIEEAGKTKIIELKNITDMKLLSSLQPGDPTKLVIKRSKIFVQTPENTYIGMFPDRLGMRLIAFIQGGNEYQAFIQGVDEKTVTVFIREHKRAKKFKNMASFTSSVV